MTDTSRLHWKTLQQFISTRTFIRHSLYTNASFIWGSRALRSGLTFVFWLIAARLYSKEAIGLAGATISVILLLGNLSSLGLNLGIIRFLPESDHSRELINTTFKLVIAACGLASAVFLAGIDWWSPALAGVITGGLSGVIFIVLAMGNVLFDALVAIFVALRIAYNNLVIALIGGGLRIGLVLFFLVTSASPAAMSLVTAYSGALLLAALVGVLILLPRYLPGYRPAWKGLPLRSVSPMLRFSLANYLNGFLWLAPAYLFPIVVINILGEQAAADFYIAWLLTNTMTMFSTSLAISLFAEGSNASHQLFDNAKRSLWSGLLVTGLCVVGLFIVARPILLMFGEEYSTEAVGLVRVLCLAVFLDVIPTNYMAIARVKKWMGSVIGIAAVRAVLALVAGVWLTTLYGPIGLGIAWVGAQVVAVGMAVVLMLSRTRKPLISILS